VKHERVEARLSIEHVDAQGLRALDADEWDALSIRAVVENPFYARGVVLAGLDTIDNGAQIEALVLRGERRELLGLFPFQSRRLPFDTADGAGNLYQPCRTPLVRREYAREVVAAWLDAVAHMQGVPRFWRFKDVHLASKLFRLVDDAVVQRGLCRIAVNPYKRPHLTRLEGGIDGHIEHVLPKRRLKDIERNIRRLSKLGNLRFERSRDPDTVARRLEQFLELENSGWKGKAGTALLAKREDAGFARSAFSPRSDGLSLINTDTLLIDDYPIAISFNLQARHTAYTAKVAYDETYRRYSPGFVLEYFVILAFYDDGTMHDMDAATTEEGHVIAALWNGHKDVGTVFIGPDDWRTRAMAALTERLHASRQFAKSIIKGRDGRIPTPAIRAIGWLKNGRRIPWEVGIAALAAK
jgi:CelD/BcsL family acetyltransferase involved in cellulose biosynthesis